MFKRVFPIVTVSSIEQMPDDHGLIRYEVIEGELHIASEPVIKRQAVVTKLCAVFGRTLDANPLGKAFPAPPVVINKHDGVARDFSYLIPDFAYVSDKHFGEVINGVHFTAAPDLVVEVALPEDEGDQHNRFLKRDLFQKLGVREYWIVEPEHRSILVFSQSVMSELTMVEFGGDDEVNSSVLPALRFATRELFIF